MADNTLKNISSHFTEAGRKAYEEMQEGRKMIHLSVSRERARLFEPLGRYIQLLDEYSRLMWPKEDPITRKVPDLSGRSYDARRASLLRGISRIEGKIREAGSMLLEEDRWLSSLTETMLAKASAGNRDGSSEESFRSFVTEAENLMTATARGTMLSLRTPAKRNRFEDYNRKAFLRIVFGPHYEGLASFYPQAYDSLEMGVLYDFASGKDLPEDEEGRRLDPILEQFGFVPDFIYGLPLDDFESSGETDPSVVFAETHGYQGKELSDFQKYADEVNVRFYGMWLGDAHEAVMAATKRREGESDREFRDRTLPVAARLLSGRRPYESWMDSYADSFGSMIHRLHLEPKENARLFHLATGGELEVEKEKKEKKAKKTSLAVGDTVITPTGENGTVVRLDGDTATVSLGNRNLRFAASDLTSGVAQKPGRNRPPAGTPCMKESLEAAKAKLRNIRDVEIPAITEEIARARELGDLRENAEYQYAREKKRNLEKDAERLSDQINAAVPMDGSERFGKQYTYTDLDTGETRTVTLVGPWEADGKTLINCQSPLGETLWGMEAGETKSFGTSIGQRTIRLDGMQPSPDLEAAVRNSAERFGTGEKEAPAAQDLKVYHSNDTKSGLLMTGYYSRSGEYVNPVSITRSKKIELPNRLEELAPSWEILEKYKNDHDERAYAEAYAKQLDSVDWDKVCEKVSGLIEKGGPVTLVCFEKPGDFCHRYIARERLEKEMDRRRLLEGLTGLQEQPDLFSEIQVPDKMDVQRSSTDSAQRTDKDGIPVSGGGRG